MLVGSVNGSAAKGVRVRVNLTGHSRDTRSADVQALEGNAAL